MVRNGVWTPSVKLGFHGAFFELEFINYSAIGGNDALRTEMMQRSGRHTVPQIFIGDHHVGGFDDLSAAERSGELDRLLAA